MRPLGGDKPCDLGTGVVCASLTADGSWLSAGRVHEGHGFVELSALPSFDEAVRGDPKRTREYRRLMLEPRFAFLTILPVPAEEPSASHSRSDGSGMRAVRRYASCALVARMTGRNGEDHLRQQVSVRAQAGRPHPRSLRLRFSGRLDRPALAEITEVDPPVPTGASTSLSASGGVLRVMAPALPAEATVGVSGGAASGWRISRSGAEIDLWWPPEAATAEWQIEVALTGPTAGAGLSAASVSRGGRPPPGPPAGSRLEVPQRLRTAVERIRRRALHYVAGCTALLVADGQVAILTDHRILPLSWTRDAYFQAALLLAEAARGDRPDLLLRVEDHLRWLWLGCDRPDGTWARSHHANGARKDDVFQADQQLYPLLELADFWNATGRLPELPREAMVRGGWPRLTGAVLDWLTGALSGDGLLATDENAADDSVAGSYLLSNQVLAWHSLQRLTPLHVALELDHGIGELAERLRRTAIAGFAADGPDGRLWAYGLDRDGNAALYHDANDVPTALAPLWGFCGADDGLWRNTMRFAFSASNEGYVAGPFGGLGSRHTPGTWSLGLIQEWAASSLAGEVAAAETALERLVRLALVDGSLPETSDPHTGAALARHWFAWPGALLGALVDVSPEADQ